jgi:hypothetical protein
MICYKNFPEPMKIMNISSPLRTLPQLLALLVAIACTLPHIHAKVGEQENWYLDREIRLPETTSMSAKYYQDSLSGKEYLFGTENSYDISYLTRFDLNSTTERFFSTKSIHEFDILPDGSIIASVGQWDSNTLVFGYHIDQIVTKLSVEYEGNFQQGLIEGVTFTGGTRHPDDEGYSLQARVYQKQRTTDGNYTIDKIDLSNISPRYLTPPTLTFYSNPGYEELLDSLPVNQLPRVNISLGSGYRFTPLDEDLPTNQIGADLIKIGTDGKIYISKGVRKEGETWRIEYYLIKVYELSNEADLPEETELSLVNSFKIFPGSAPGQTDQGVSGITSTVDGTIIISADRYFHFFTPDGNFIRRIYNYNSGRYLNLNKANQILSSSGIYDIEGKRILTSNIFSNNYYDDWNRAQWTHSSDIISIQGEILKHWKRAYRTKGLPTPNVIPQPVVHSISQRPGTNILDIDFEVIDPDDDTVTAGILGTIAIEDSTNEWGEYQNNSNQEFNDLTKLIIPTSLTDGTDSLIGQPIATNEIHRVSWYVKGDWSELTGDLKVGVFAQDARRSMPVDLHFLKIPTEDGNLTISRSPLKDSDMLNYFQYLLSIGDPRVKFENGKILNSSDESFIENISNDYSSLGIGISKLGRDFFMNDLGYRWASIAELSIAREAATPGTVNEWDATNQVKPRNLPGRVNEYGFDTGNHGTRAWWVVKESSLEIPVFTSFVIDNDHSQNEEFGGSLSISGNNIIVGHNSWDKRWVNYYQYNQADSSVSFVETIRPSDFSESTSEGFGRGSTDKGINLVGTNLAVGSSQASASDGNGYGAGAVYLFEVANNSHTQEQRLISSDGMDSDSFGTTIDIDGDLLVVGAPQDDISGNQDAGSAYLFKRGTNGQYSEIAKLLPEESQSGASFGYAVAIENGVIAVGAITQKIVTNGNDKRNVGSVFIFKSTTSGEFSFIQKIEPPSKTFNQNNFGAALTLNDNLLVISEPNPVNNDWNSGAVHLFRIKNDGTAGLTSSIYSPNPRSYGKFGHSVAIDGDRLVIGAPGEDSDNGSQSGVVYVYQILEDGRVRLLESLIHPTGKANDQFGQSLSISGLNILVGAPGYDLDNDRWNAGSAVLFRASQ